MKKLTFSCHDSFNCRVLWLKKGYDFNATNKKFASPDAVVELGIGKNMVNAISEESTIEKPNSDGDGIINIIINHKPKVEAEFFQNLRKVKYLNIAA